MLDDGEPVVVPIEDALDLHPFAPREISSVVESYLEAAVEAGFREVRLIHGRGRGVQRERVRAVLAASPYVARFDDAPSARGGSGATIAWLRPPARDRLVALWRDAERVVVLTGAGLSTASGIPDFRSPGGRWERYQPVPLPEFLASEEKRAEYWQYKGETWRLINAARPNAAHVALADLARAGRIALLVTQNVDGLHERSGFPADRLVNIHGTDSAVECMRCHRREPRALAQEAWEAGTAVPRCGCGGPWKPATISFGQSLVAADLERAMRAAAGAGLLLAAGSSLVVGPVNQMVPAARAAGGRIAIVTASETPFDLVADVKIADAVEDVLPAVRDALE